MYAYIDFGRDFDSIDPVMNSPICPGCGSWIWKEADKDD
jgi:hypothetical protein